MVRRSGSIRRQHACQPWHSTTPLRCPRRVLKMVWERGDWTKHLLSSQQRHRTFSCRLQIPDWEAASVWVDKNQQVNLALSHAIRGGLEVAGEVTEKRLNKTTRGFVSSLRMLTCTVTPRLVTDGGFELGRTSGGPRALSVGRRTWSQISIVHGDDGDRAIHRHEVRKIRLQNWWTITGS